MSGTGTISTAPSAFFRPGQPETGERPRQKRRFSARPSNAMTAAVSSWRRSTNGSRKTGLQPLRNDRRFAPPGVKDVASYGWTTYKRGVAHEVAHIGGARFWQLQICTIRGQSPRRCGPGCGRESALDAGWHGLPKSYGVKSRGAPASRVHPLARRVVAPHGRGRKWRERPPVFWRWCATGEG